MKNWMKASLAFALSLALGFAGGLALLNPSVEATPGLHAEWISDADTIEQQVEEADLIVRSRVIGQAPTRAVSADLGGDRPSVVLFTDSRVEILEVYKGKAEGSIEILQTGGELAGTKGADALRQSLPEDPVFEVGSEQVLFLVDITGDPVHAAGRKLYRAVNPASRYDLQGAGRVASTELFGNTDQRPVDLGTLESQIRWYVDQQ